MTLQAKMEALLKELEAERGCPVQIQIDTPYTANNFSNRETEFLPERVYVGGFEERPLSVKRVENLDSRYEHDVAVLEGDYASFKAFKEKFHKLSEVILYGPPYYREDMVTAHFRKYIGEDVSLLVWTDKEDDPRTTRGFDFDRLYSLLDTHHVSYVTFPFEITPNGVYNNWARTLGVRELDDNYLKEATGDTKTIVKVTDILFERMK